MALRQLLEEENKRKADPTDTHGRSIIVLGSRGVGKSTMICRFLEKDEPSKPTIAMDYSFGRKTGRSLIKDVVHVWEIGHLSSSLVAAAMTGSALVHSPHHVTLLVMLDLGKPEILWSTLEECLMVIRSAVKMSYDASTIDSLRERMRGGERGLEFDKTLDPLPIRTCILGGRYDVFKDYDEDKKRLVGRTLRGVAHSLGAGLRYHSSKDTVLIRKTKDLLSHYGFGSQRPKAGCTDYDKPLAVPPGTDSFSSIDPTLTGGTGSAILDSMKQTYVAHIPQDSKGSYGVKPEDPSNDPNFQEPTVDRLKSQREEEISVLLRDMLEGRVSKIAIPGPL
ncbi:cytoplasmic dynein 2 light intermediate chain 1 [Orussus abietinus]|uniref:cytoplasmic dynein 2 light intermediate chain 1 n=1 Tax=Orussus abietinus TaxID=222816 RepID=UPI000C716259|nr:cytoplasmic dynein 2 light intermediate chain 1 [Orussus abietinus]